MGTKPAPSSTAPNASAPAVAPSALASAAEPRVAVDARAPDSSLQEFVGGRTEPSCKAQTIEIAAYQQRGDVALAGRPGALAAVWRVGLSNKAEEQVAFASYDEEGHGTGRPRGVGKTQSDMPPRVFPAGSDWTVTWFDRQGLAHTRARTEPGTKPEINHLGSVTAELAPDVGLSTSASGAILAATPFGENHSKLGLFLFAPVEEGAPPVNAFAVTHRTKEPHRAAVSMGPRGTFAAYAEGDLLRATRFDGAGKEVESPCPVAPKQTAPRDRLSLTATDTGALLAYAEGTSIHTRALDAFGCPASPTWTIAQGRWPLLAPLGDGALLVWVSDQGRLLGVRIGANGAPSGRGLDAAEGTTGVKAPPSVTAFGGKVAFGWSETMGPTVSTKRLLVRILNAACIP